MKRGNPKMFTELHYHTNHEIRQLNLAEKMAERRNDSLAPTSRLSLGARIARLLFTPAVAAESSEAGGRA
jgi:hypothetical protein